MEYRQMKLDEAEKIKQIDATNFIKNVWRDVDGKRELVEINWTDNELPNGIEWHLTHYKKVLERGGCAFGCFDNGILVGYGTLDAQIFGTESKYVLLDQLFVSNEYRNKHIGRKIVSMCTEKAKTFGADKIYICAGSSENTIAFYKKLGCIDAVEVKKELVEEDPRDIQLELRLK